MKKPIVKIRYGKGKDPHDALIENLKPVEKPKEETSSLVTPPPPTPEEEEFAAPPICLDKFPDPIRRYIEQGIKFKDIYPQKRSQYIMAVFSMISSVVGHRYYYGDGATRTYGNEWVIYVAHSGKGKSYSVDSGLEFLEHLTDRGRNLFYANEEHIRKLRRQLRELEAERAKIEKIKDVTIGVINTIKQEIIVKENEIEGAKKKQEFLRRYSAKLDDGSIEGVKVNMSKTRGKLLFAEELADFWSNLQSSTRSKDPSTSLISLHKAQSREKDLVSGGAPMTIRHPALSLALITVPESLSRCFSETHIATGFLSRFMFSYDPTRHTELKFSIQECLQNPEPQELESILIDVYKDFIDTAYRRVAVGIDPCFVEFYDASLGYQVAFTQGAIDAANEFAKDFLRPQLATLPELWASAVAPRWKDHLLKVAMVFAVIRLRGETREVKVSCQDIFAAMEIVRYSIHCERFCLGSIIKNSRSTRKHTVAQNTELVFGVIERLIQKKGVAKRSDVLNNANLSGGARELNAVLETLLEANRVEEYKEGKSTFYRLPTTQ